LKAERFPHSQASYEGLVSLPIYPRMSDGDVARVMSEVQAALGQ
jgi:dTDP-4-amino-4,6-dideoxygalactose transaminase